MTDRKLQFQVTTNSSMESLVRDPVLFLELLSKEQRQLIAGQVVSQLENQDGAPTLIDLYIDHILFEAKSSQGSFRLHFKIARQFCCSDLSSCQADYIDFQFKKNNSIIYITGSYIYWAIQ